MTCGTARDTGLGVQAFRHLLAQRHVTLLICACALLLRLIVPTGYMIGDDHGRIAITVCSGFAPPSDAMAMPGMDGDMAMMHGSMPDPGRSRDHGRTEMPCAFAGLSAQVLGTGDVGLRAIALAVVAAKVPRGVPGVAPRPAPHLRPPLRGPPLPNGWSSG